LLAATVLCLELELPQLLVLVVAQGTEQLPQLPLPLLGARHLVAISTSMVAVLVLARELAQQETLVAVALLAFLELLMHRVLQVPQRLVQLVVLVLVASLAIQQLAALQVLVVVLEPLRQTIQRLVALQSLLLQAMHRLCPLF